MNPELQASVSLDRTIDRASMAPDASEAYTTFANEVFETRKQLSPEGYREFVGLADKTESYQISDIALGYALSNFEIIDSDGNDEIEPDELASRKKLLSESPVDSEFEKGDLPAAFEMSLIENLEDRISHLATESKDGFFSNWGVQDSGITRNDLGIVADRSNSIRAKFGDKPLYDGPNEIDSVKNLPSSVKELLNLGGVEIKSVPGKLSRELAEHSQKYPTISIAAGIYSRQTNEIISERGKHQHHYRQHEIGHYIDDVLVPGRESLSDSDNFDQVVSLDLESLPKDVDWMQEIPTLHPYILNALNRGSFNDYSKKELFADIYQSDDTVAGAKLRKYFPETSKLVDDRLAKEGIKRFTAKQVPTV